VEGGADVVERDGVGGLKEGIAIIEGAASTAA